MGTALVLVESDNGNFTVMRSRSAQKLEFVISCCHLAEYSEKMHQLISLFIFLIFLTKTREQQNGRLLVVVYFSFISDAFRLYWRLLIGMNTTEIGQHVYHMFVPKF